MAQPATNETHYEDEHVHQVYNKIASHFSSTRFKPWPVVDAFLRSRPPGSVGLDIGCGNGKYLTVNKDVFILASDRSCELIKFATAHQPHDACIADTLCLPHPDGAFDFAISIAVVHHLSSRARRRDAIRCILATLKRGPQPASGCGSDTRSAREATDSVSAAEALVFVWALEQKGSRRGWDAGDDQDVLVPWVMRESRAGESEAATTYQRYYHLYRRGELEEDIEAVGGTVVRNGYDRDNWWAVFSRHVLRSCLADTEREERTEKAKSGSEECVNVIR